jgi:hypothetical protein
LSGVQPHTFGVPAPPQEFGAAHVPHETACPQLFVTPPQFFPAQAAALSGVQPHVFGVPPPPHVFGNVQEPHEMVCPQLFVTSPQFLPRQALTLSGVQPQRLGIPPPPHVSGAVHLPQLSVPPHPSETVPQFAPPSAHVRGVQSVTRTTAFPSLPQKSRATAVIVFAPSTMAMATENVGAVAGAGAAAVTVTVADESSTVPETVIGVVEKLAPFRGDVMLMAGGVRSASSIVAASVDPGLLLSFTRSKFLALSSTGQRKRKCRRAS